MALKRDKRVSLSTKFNLLTISLILATSLGITLFIIWVEIRKTYQELLNHGQIIASMVSQNSEYGIYTEDRESLTHLIGSLEDPNIAYILILNQRGAPLAHKFFKSTMTSPPALLYEELTLTNRFIHKEFINRQDEKPYIDIQAPVISYKSDDASGIFKLDEKTSKQKVIGYVQIGLTQERFRKYINQFLLSTLLFTSFIAFVGVGLTLFITKRITFPIKKLRWATQEISEGKFDHRIEIETNDEISDLSLSFNHMLEHLKIYRIQVEERTADLTVTNQKMFQEITERKRAEEALQKAHDELEKRVQERTEELAKINEALRAEIIERKRSEEERSSLQEQLQQAQKMEAVGQLAGGVAHDFNNLLTVITGYSDLMLGQLNRRDSLYGDVVEIKRAAERAASLTRQLLAFSRKQVLQPKVLDLNQLVANMDKMLRRLIGEDIELFALMDDKLGKIKADPGQIEQVILNLAVNARDAMPKGGKLTIETANVELDKNYVRSHLGAKTGHYAMFSISDTGVGMPPEIRERVFEPFFTTKEKGRGTGLGLSTVYGIVKQSEGYIWVYSEPGRGTTFKIYFPMVEGADELLKPMTASTKPMQGTETILLVEDEEMVRGLVRMILERNGYHVLEASNGEEALRIAQEHGSQKIHLMVTDVVMPGMSGRELADCMSSLRPEMKVIYISGYTNNAIVHHGVLEQGTAFLQKPFTASVLTRKVRDILDGHS
jgi:signal transduction histidine kinase